MEGRAAPEIRQNLSFPFISVSFSSLRKNASVLGDPDERAHPVVNSSFLGNFFFQFTFTPSRKENFTPRETKECICLFVLAFFLGPARSARVGGGAPKLEAAKELLLRQVAASRVQDVAFLKFSNPAEKIYYGARGNHAEATIQALATENRTNLAAGLMAVYTDPALESYSALSVLILSDGLSNVGDPLAAATRLTEKYPFARIDRL